MADSKVLFWYTAVGLSKYHAAAKMSAAGPTWLFTAHCGRHASPTQYVRRMNLFRCQKELPPAKVRCVNCERKLRRIANERV